MKKRDEISVKLPLDHQANNYLLIIGIDKYQSGISNLNNAVYDAITFKDSLIKRYQFEEKNCILLLDMEATRESLIDTFDDLTTKVTSQDNLVIYYAGHGTFMPEINEGFWLLSDSKKGKRSSFLSNKEVSSFVKNLKAKHVFGVIDSCFAGSFFRSDGEIPLSGLYQYKSRFFITSGRLELVPDGHPGHHSPFCKIILEQLNFNQEAALWSGDIYRAVLKGVNKKSTDQLPQGEPLKDLGHEGGEFPFLLEGKSIDDITFRKNTEKRKEQHKLEQEKQNAINFQNNIRTNNGDVKKGDVVFGNQIKK